MAFSYYYGEGTNSRVESRAILEGVKLCIEKWFHFIEVESDSRVVVVVVD